MKKIWALLVCVLLCLAFWGCADETTADESLLSHVDAEGISEEQKQIYYQTFKNFKSAFTDTEKETDNYRITSSEKYAGNFYEIYDNDKNLLDKGFHDWQGAFDISQDGEIVVLKYGYGGNAQPSYRVYDVKNGRVSRYYKGPFTRHGNLVAYFRLLDDDAVLVVQDAFDVGKSYQEFDGKFDRFIGLKIVEFSFSDDGTSVYVKHCETNNKKNILEESFELK